MSKVDRICKNCGVLFCLEQWQINKGGGTYCSRKCSAVDRYMTHGHSANSPTYRTWKAMKSRCENPKHEKYLTYGGAGISVCARWARFENFLADMGERPADKTIDRIDGSRGYEPDNCRWATRSEQQRNLKSNVVLEFGGTRKHRFEWAADLGIHDTTLKWRLEHGWPLDKALTTGPTINAN